MVAISPVPSVELERAADAGVQLVDVAKNLSSLAAEVQDPQIARALRAQISRLLDTVEVVNGVVRSSAYVRTPVSS